MKRLLPLVVVAAGLSAGCMRIISRMSYGGNSEPEIRGEGELHAENRTVESFHAIDVGSSIRLSYKQGPTSVKVFAQPNVLSHVTTKTQHGALKVYIEGNLSDIKEVRVEVSSPSIDAIDASGAATVELNEVTSPKFQLSASGASNVSGELRAETIELDVSGSAQVEAGGLKLTSISGDLSGASSVKLSGTGSNVKLELSGSSRFEGLNLSAQTVDLQVSGNSTIDLSGTAESLAITAEGSSQANLGGLTAKNCQAHASGASSAVVSATGSLVAEASGAARVLYSGNPKSVTRNTSGAGNIDGN